MTAPDPAKPAAGLAPGTLVAGRFQTERTIAQDALGIVLAAKDQKTGKPVSLRLVARTVIRDTKATEALRTEVMKVAMLSHRSIVATYGVGADPKLGWYVASEWTEGDTLAAMIAKRKSEGQVGMSLRGAYNVAAHVAAALTAAHAKQSVHGGVRPGVVWIAQGGRVKLGELGLDRAVLRTSGAAALGATEQAWLAPEVKTGAAADAKTDVFGLGALLYAMLTGRSPTDEFIAPSQASPDATPDVDAIVLRCLAPDPSQRFATPDEVRKALQPLAAATAPRADDMSVDIDVDVDMGGGGAAAAPAAPRAGAAPKRPAPPPARPAAPGPGGPAAPRVGQRVSAKEQFRTSLPAPEPSSLPPVGGPSGQPGAPGAPAAAPSASGESQSALVDLGSLLAKISENDAPRWMVQKDKLDHGPFTGRELVQAILKGDVREEHGLLNMDTGERRKVRAFAEFVEFLDQFKIREQEAHQKAALERSDKVETAGNAAKIFIALGVLAVVGAGIGIFVYSRKQANDQHLADANLADLYERGQIPITGTAGILPPPPRGSGGGHHGGGGGGRGGMTYEDAMNQAVNLGNAASGGGEQQLTPSTVAGVMNAHLQSLYGCVGQELRSGGHVGNVQIDLAIAGSGQVLGASVHGGSGAFQSCISGRTRSIHFPAFSAPRMGARYSFSVD